MRTNLRTSCGAVRCAWPLDTAARPLAAGAPRLVAAQMPGQGGVSGGPMGNASGTGSVAGRDGQILVGQLSSSKTCKKRAMKSTLLRSPGLKHRSPAMGQGRQHADVVNATSWRPFVVLCITVHRCLMSHATPRAMAMCESRLRARWYLRPAARTMTGTSNTRRHVTWGSDIQQGNNVGHER